MDTIFELPRAAARSVRRGWARGVWDKPDGRVCMVQAIRKSARGAVEIRQVEFELDRQLRSSPSYRLIKRVGKRRGWGLEKQLYSWNDLPWRKQYEVVAALDELADRLEASARAEECERLQSLNEILTGQITKLQEYIRALEAEVPWLLGRRKHSADSKRSRAELESLRAELAANGLVLDSLQQVA
jgi:hypothetical protein